MRDTIIYFSQNIQSCECYIINSLCRNITYVSVHIICIIYVFVVLKPLCVLRIRYFNCQKIGLLFCQLRNWWFMLHICIFKIVSSYVHLIYTYKNFMFSENLQETNYVIHIDRIFISI